MNGFELHNIKHSSASSINLWNAAPDIWIAEKIFGIKSPVGAAAHRGNAVEAALVNILAYGVDKNEAINQAIQVFNGKTALSGGEDNEKERSSIPSFVDQGLEALAPFGKPFFERGGEQNKIDLLCNGDGWSLPVIGYLDLVYPEHGLVIDIKTSHRAPSEMSADHNRQCAIYRRACGNSHVRFLYLTPKKSVWHECPDIDGTLSEIKAILNDQEKFLRSSTKESLTSWHEEYKRMFIGGRNRFGQK